MPNRDGIERVKYERRQEAERRVDELIEKITRDGQVLVDAPPVKKLSLFRRVTHAISVYKKKVLRAAARQALKMLIKAITEDDMNKWLKQPSTWTGLLLAIIGVTGMAISEEVVEMAAAGVVTLIGAYDTWRNERTEGDEDANEEETDD